MAEVIIFSPNRYSLYTLCVAEILRQEDVEVLAIVVRKLMNPGRFFSEFRRDGVRLIKKIVKKLVLKSKAYKAENYETIVDLMKSYGMSYKKVEDFAKQFDIPVIYCKNLNDDIVLQTLKCYDPDLVVFTGGGLIRKPILENSGFGVLNCHMGVLPKYRGMDVVEWPILENNMDKVGLTVHFMDEGLDTGDILQVTKVELNDDETIGQLRDRFEPIMCREFVNAILEYYEGDIQPKTQSIKDGKQYFIMHPKLYKLAESRLKSYLDNTI